MNESICINRWGNEGTDSNSELRSVKDKRRPASVVVKSRGK
jgi:hypothetical protein